MEALTDAYLHPDIGIRKSEYARLRREIEKDIAEWKREAKELQARMDTKSISQEQMQAAEELAAEVRKGIDLLAFEEKRKVLQLLGIQGTVRQDDAQVSIRVEGLERLRPDAINRTGNRCQPSLPRPGTRASWTEPGGSVKARATRFLSIAEDA